VDAVRGRKELRALQFERDGSVWVPLTHGARSRIDLEDAVLAEPWNWHLSRFGYAVRKPTTGVVFLHRAILAAPKGVEVDHKNGDRLDNRRSNLRLVSHANNCKNSALRRDNACRLKGVSWHKHTGRWRAVVQINGRPRHLGLFDTAELAFEAYEREAARLFGEFKRAPEHY